jgi:hypothetical protein
VGAAAAGAHRALEDYARGLEAIGGFDFREPLGEIRAPTLVIAGAEDARRRLRMRR